MEKHESQYAVEYEIQISDDMKNWKTVRAKKRGDGGGLHRKERIPFSYVTRYIRLLTHKRRMEYGYSIYEFEVLAPE